MRDDGHKWDVPTSNPIDICGFDVSVTRIRPSRQLMISGTNVLKSTRLPLVGWPGDIDTDAYALVLRRDRILEINGPPKADGWDEASESAVSDMTDGYAVLSIEGPESVALLKRGAFLNTTRASQSVARVAFGLPVILYRCVQLNRFTLHVSSSMESTLIKQIESV